MIAMRRSFNVAEEVAAIGDLSREQLAARWQKTHGHLPPKGMHVDLLRRSAAWDLQARRLGGISAETRRLLRPAISAVEGKRSACGKTDNAAPHAEKADRLSTRKARRKLLPGVQLLRDWNGRTHVVEVIEEGFVFQAKLYKSLTAIAREITGAHWSGPRFFGL